MLSKIILHQVTSHKEFKLWLLSNPLYERVYNCLGKPKPFDVTLRDGLQGLSKEQQIKYHLLTKKNLYEVIIKDYCCDKIEVGSIVSEKVYPIFQDTLELLNYVENNIVKLTDNTPVNTIFNYILVPNSKYLSKIINTTFVNHFAFITSISNQFQMQNTKMTLEDSDKEIQNMLISLKDRDFTTVKLYVSCINECPIQGKLDNDFIVNRLLTLNELIQTFKIPVTICLSDTCGTLTAKELEYILLSFKLVKPSFSLHLHVIPGREKEVEKLIHKALDYGITEFDTSLLETGGCAKVIGIKPNLSYSLYYFSLMTYIEKHAK
jgi:isopropylmalate/homocitrate/citramalate synthase